MALSLNLQKSQQALTLNLQKAGITTPPAVDMMFVMDVSGSFEDEHVDGITNDLLTRLVPWGLTFDPDKKLDLLVFSDGPGSVQNVGPVTESNYENFVKNKIIRKVRGWNGGTDYSYAIEESLREFGWIDNEDTKPAAKPVGFFGKMFGKKDEALTETAKPAARKSLVLFVTDGENSDRNRTVDILRQSEARGDGCYFLFIGVANGGGKFTFLEQLGDKFNNTGFYHINDLRSFVKMSDEQLYEELLQEELLNWMKK